MHALTRPILPVLALVLLAACETPAPPPAPSGAEDYAAYCAACHGPQGRGDGPAAAGLPQRPADLTRLSDRNGGTFPATRVMAKIWGYTGGRQGSAVMPAFGALLEGETVLYDGGDGIDTPTPLPLVQLAEYLRGLQG
ncbi:MAG TPA: c-type cytochrome [Paracoccaceae bacterium]|nr:c-type cytochrome [Paracoccaceae bacterium]